MFVSRRFETQRKEFPNMPEMGEKDRRVRQQEEEDITARLASKGPMERKDQDEKHRRKKTYGRSQSHR